MSKIPSFQAVGEQDTCWEDGLLAGRKKKVNCGWILGGCVGCGMDGVERAGERLKFPSMC